MFAENKRMCLVTNRSASRVCYAIPELGIKLRDFQPNETKKISYEELEALTYIPGGLKIMRDYLQIAEIKTREQLIGNVEPEYNMNEAQVKNLILTPGNYDEWLDCLDFAPEGVIDMIKNLSVKLPLTDTVKMQQFKEKTGIDIAKHIQIHQEEIAEQAAEAAKTEQQGRQRRTRQTAAAEESTAPVRRTDGSKYKVIKQG